MIDNSCHKPCVDPVPLTTVTMQNYNAQLVKYLEDMRKGINDSLATKRKTMADYEKTITEIEGAYFKILESSQTLLHVLKRESKSLMKKQNQL
mmetsp:Transcript_24719/g.56854  ORF Transcript_24719/g.56854 Transcript_24719/m.56854 type:complete len:93 (+) Transcript_24719:15-293(+)